MNLNTKIKFLKVALFFIGLILLFAILPLMQFWPAGWRWMPHQSEYEQMIVGVYATLGIFLIRAAKDPLKHLSLIWFTVWSSVVHGGIMAAQAIVEPMESGHFIGDIPALFIIAIVLAVLTPRNTEA